MRGSSVPTFSTHNTCVYAGNVYTVGIVNPTSSTHNTCVYTGNPHNVRMVNPHIQHICNA